MKSLLRNVLLGAAGLVASSLPAHAVSPTAVADTPLFKLNSTTKPMLMAQRPSAGSVGFTSAGSVGYKKAKKAKKKKAKK